MADVKVECAKKHNCRDCLACQWCSDSKCRMCLMCKPKEESKTVTENQMNNQE